MPLTIEEKLDLILNETKDHFGHLPEDRNWERICRLVTDGDGSTTGNPDFKNDPQLKMHIKYLEDEGYAAKFFNTIVNREYLVVTTKGLLFEGFVNYKNRLDTERQENTDLLRYRQEVEKHPFEMEALQTSIESNKSTVRLARESISHFNDARSVSKKALFATLGVSICTLIILVVQTYSTNKTEIEKPIKVETKQVEQLIKSQERNSLILSSHVDSLRSGLSSQVDSLKSELKKLNKTLRKKRNG